MNFDGFWLFWRRVLGQNHMFCMKIIFSNIEQTTHFLLEKNVFWVTFLKKQHRGTPEMTRTQKCASTGFIRKGDFGHGQSDLGFKI